MISFFQVSEQLQSQLLSKPRIEPVKRPSEKSFNVILRPMGGEEVIFLSGTSPETAYRLPPLQLHAPEEILSLDRTEFALRSNLKGYSLSRPWELQFTNFPPILGTADHHELYYSLLQQDRKDSSPGDVLVNIDSHNDVTQGDGIESDNNEVTLANFIGQGFRDTFRKVWDHYIWITDKDAYGGGVEKNLKDVAERFDPTQMQEALGKAVRIAQQKNSKIILTIDLDFFGAGAMKNKTGNTEFKPEIAKQQLEFIFQFIKKNHQFIRLVHFSESLGYVIKGNEQVLELYKQMVPLLNEISQITSETKVLQPA
jgi:hypothetical protein